MTKKLNVIMLTIISAVLIVFIAFQLILMNRKPAVESHSGGILPKLTMEDILASSSLVIRAVYTGDTDVMRVKSARSGSELNFTDHYFTPVEIYRGECDDQKRVAVRLDGGSINGINEICDDNPKFKKGKEYILCLYNPGVYYEFNTDDEHYYIPGINQGVFELSGASREYTGKALTANSVKTGIDPAKSAQEVSFTADGLKSYMQKYNKDVPVNKNYTMEHGIANAKDNFENGFITEEEYKAALNVNKEYGKVTAVK